MSKETMDKVIEMEPATTEKDSAALYTEAMNAANAYVSAFNDGRKTEVDALRKTATSAFTAFNNQVAKEYYIRLSTLGDPIKSALLARYVSGVKKPIYKTDKNTGSMSVTTKSVKMKADLKAMDAVIGARYFADPTWFDKMQRFSALIEKRINGKLEYKFDAVFTDDDIRKCFDISADADMTSIKTCVKALQKCVDAILYIPAEDKSGNPVNNIKVDARFLNAIVFCITGQGDGIMEVEVHGTTNMTELVADAICAILNGNTPKTNRID